MDKILIICGPTATGKTGLAIKLAKKFNGEIISADSRQVYKQMDIVTGKDIITNSKLKAQNAKLKIKEKNYDVGFRLKENIPIWLVDVCQPDQEFSVAHFARFTKLIIKDIQSRNKLPIIVGGTGFYIKALIKNVDSIDIKPDFKLRENLETKSVDELQKILRKIWPEKLANMNNSDIKNPRRLIRAIEIAKSDSLNIQSRKNQVVHNVLTIGLRADDATLVKKIKQRIGKRIKIGAIEETKNLWKNFSGKNLILNTTLGYKQLFEYLNKRISSNKAIDNWLIAEIAYSKRQITWFKKIASIKWFLATDPDLGNQVEKVIKKWYYTTNAKKG